MKTSNNKKTIDGYLVADVMAVITIIIFILFILKTDKPKLLFSSLISAGVTGISGLFQMLFGNAQVTNNSSNHVFAKDEGSDELIKVQPNEVHSGLDGVNVGGKIYKLPDGVHATINANGKLNVTSIIGKFVYKVRGGELQNAPDSGWNNLFNA